MSKAPDDRKQHLRNLKDEIAFRAKLARQHVTGEVILPDYNRREEHDRILLERVEATRTRMAELARAGVKLSPFLELGAERGQRSSVLVNDFGATGIAADISYHQLLTLDHFSQLFRRERLPTRVYCDANHLPFRRGAFSLVFCYQFPHHFPSLPPIASEINRVPATATSISTKSRSSGRRGCPTTGSSTRSTHGQRCARALDDGFWRASSPRSAWTRSSTESSRTTTSGCASGSMHFGFSLNATSIWSRSGGSSRSSAIVGAAATSPIFCSVATWPASAARSLRPPAGSPQRSLSCAVVPIARRLSAAPWTGPRSRRGQERFFCPQCGAKYFEKNGIFVLLPQAELDQLYPELANSGRRA